jgi:hypothetical protein
LTLGVNDQTPCALTTLTTKKRERPTCRVPVETVTDVLGA